MFILIIVLAVCLVIAVLFKPHTILSVPSLQSLPSAPQVTHQTIVKGGDSRYDRAPQPLRDWMAPPEFPPRGGLTSMPINIPTQGLPESFQSVGIINVGDQVLPLYGRRTAGSSDRWNYYTRTDTYNPVPVPIRFGKRDCMDDVGCNEIMSGETVTALNKEGKTDIYRFDGPKYIPGMI
jgi:hypothetical protein